MNRGHVLVVDDEESICWALERMLLAEGHQVSTAASAEAGLRLAAEQRCNLVLLDVRLPGRDGISALPDFLSVTGGAPVVVMTAFGDLETAVGAVRHGACDYLTKPFELNHVRQICQSALARSPALPDRADAQATSGIGRRQRNVADQKLVGQSPAMQHAFRQIALAASSDLSVLITGETGTGKELVAAAIHRHSHRSEQPYFPVAPVALSPELVESELFGHVRGAFTGATEDRIGLFERADRGTVLLDEIGDLPLNIQVKLLRVLEQGEFSRVGDLTPRRCNVRILAATHSDLHAAVRAGKFREDLFFRLGGLHIHLPPLRERIEDLPLLCEHFRQQFLPQPRWEPLDTDVIAELQRRPWHGNLRELRNAVEHACVVAQGRSFVIDDFPAPQPGRHDPTRADVNQLETAIQQWTDDQLRRHVADQLLTHLHFAVEPTLIRKVLSSVSGNRNQAAEILGIHRGTLRDKMRKYGLE